MRYRHQWKHNGSHSETTTGFTVHHTKLQTIKEQYIDVIWFK